MTPIKPSNIATNKQNTANMYIFHGIYVFLCYGMGVIQTMENCKYVRWGLSISQEFCINIIHCNM